MVDPRSYLEEYYRTLGAENQALLAFLIRSFDGLGGADRPVVLDFGCGPTLYTAIVAAPHAREIHLSDFSPENLEAVRAVLSAAPMAFDWRPYVRAILDLEDPAGQPHSEDDVALRMRFVRERVTRLLSCDARDPRPLRDGAVRYDVVVANFCAEVAARNRREWSACMANIHSLLRLGGRMIVTAVTGSDTYTVDGGTFPVARIRPEDLREQFSALGFGRTVLETVPADGPSRIYTGLAMAMGS